MNIERTTSLLLVGVALLVLTWAAVVVWLSLPIDGVDIGKAGLFGDSFGLLTSMFSGLAFAGLIGTLLLQRQELKLQREELQLTRIELSRAATAQLKQVEALENTARLNALSTLAQAYTDISLMRAVSYHQHAEEAKPKRDQFLQELEEFLLSVQPERSEDGS